jgi:hypothetical protein
MFFWIVFVLSSCLCGSIVCDDVISYWVLLNYSCECCWFGVVFCVLVWCVVVFDVMLNVRIRMLNCLRIRMCCFE